MKNFIYTLYNKLSQRYGDVFCYPSDEFAVKRLVENVQPRTLEENELVRIGSIDILSGKVEVLDPIRINLNKVEKLPMGENV